MSSQVGFSKCRESLQKNTFWHRSWDGFDSCGCPTQESLPVYFKRGTGVTALIDDFSTTCGSIHVIHKHTLCCRFYVSASGNKLQMMVKWKRWLLKSFWINVQIQLSQFSHLSMGKYRAPENSGYPNVWYEFQACVMCMCVHMCLCVCVWWGTWRRGMGMGWKTSFPEQWYIQRDKLGNCP